MFTNEVAPTPKEAATLREIIAFMTANGYAPTAAELAARMGVSATLTNWRLVSLSAKGYIRRTQRVSRSIVVLREPPATN